MRIPALLAFVVLWTGVGPPAAQAGQAGQGGHGGQGGLRWERLEVVAQASAEDESAVVAFPFANVGPSTVSITEVQPSCGCTTTQLARKTYAPGEKGSLKVTLFIGTRTGKVSKTILVQTDEGPGAMTVLVMTVNVAAPLVVNPQSLVWAVGESTAAKKLLVTAADGVKLADLSVQAMDPQVHAEVHALTAAGRYEVTVRLASASHSLESWIELTAMVNTARGARGKVLSVPVSVR